MREGFSKDAAVLDSVDRRLCLERRLPPNRACLAAISGGLDSMVLLDLLVRLAPKHGCKVVVAHANHQLRGAQSDQDQRLVEQTAARAGLECTAARLDLGNGGRGGSLEMAARRARHRFLAEAARQRGIGHVLLAHHADDQVELFLLRLLRGAGSDGLGGMRFSSPSPFGSDIQLLRPLLDQNRETLRSYALDRGLAWREDASNRDPGLGLRNRIRNQWLPRMTQPGMRSAILRTMEILREEHCLVDQQARERLQQGCSFSSAPVALQRAMLHQQLVGLGVEPVFQLVERLRQAAPGTRISASGDRSLILDARGRLREEPMPEPQFDQAEIDARVPGELSFAGMRISLSTEPWDGSPPPRRPREGTGGGGAAFSRAPGEELLDARILGTEVRFRHWRPGDRVQPLGMSGRVKLQDAFVNARIPPPIRRRLIVGERPCGGIFWVEALCIAHPVRITPETREAVRLRWKPL